MAANAKPTAEGAAKRNAVAADEATLVPEHLDQPEPENEKAQLLDDAAANAPAADDDDEKALADLDQQERDALHAKILFRLFWQVASGFWRNGDRLAWVLTISLFVLIVANEVFLTILLSEWADVGMITAATMAANNPHALAIVWAGAVAAMVTKGLVAAFLGAGLRQWIRTRIQPKHLRYASVIALAILGAAAVAEDMGWIDEE